MIFKTQVFTCQQCEYSSSGSYLSVNEVIIPQNWGAIPFFGASPLKRYCQPILPNDDRIHRHILPRTTVFPQSGRCESYNTHVEIPIFCFRTTISTKREMNWGRKLLACSGTKLYHHGVDAFMDLHSNFCIFFLSFSL